MVHKNCEMIYQSPETTIAYNEKSRYLLDMDAIKEDCKLAVGNYQMTDEEWELVKTNFTNHQIFSKEYVIHALSRLIDFVAEQDQDPIIF